MLEKDLAALVRGDAAAQDGQAERQPQLWAQVAALAQEAAEDVEALVGRALEAAGDDRLAVVLTGSGAALNAAVGACGQLAQTGDARCTFSVVDASELAQEPLQWASPDAPVLLVALSVAADDALGQAVQAVRGQAGRFFCLGAVCDAADPLAAALTDDDDALVLTVPVAGTEADQQGAGGAAADVCGFGCLLLLCLLMLDGAPLQERLGRAASARELGENVVSRGAELSALVEGPFDRVMFLCDGLAFGGAVREAERQARRAGLGAQGRPGVGHGDLRGATVDLGRTRDALTVCLVPSEPADDRAEALAGLAMLADGQADQGRTVVALQQDMGPRFEGAALTLDGAPRLPSGYLALPFLMAMQQLGLLASVK